MNASSWNHIVPTRRIYECIKLELYMLIPNKRIDGCIKLELDGSNWWIVIEPKDRIFIV